MRLAVIDMGTNTFNLLIAECFDNSFNVLYSDKIPVKLGQKSKELHIIDEAGIKRILDTLLYYKNKIKEYNADEVIAVATSSIRTAKNQNELLKTIKEHTSINVEVIDGEREAELICMANQFAVSDCRNQDSQPFLIMDIGGGSTEFILANTHQSFWKKSFLLGMARLMDEFKPQDPIDKNDIQRIHQYLDEVLKPLNEQVLKYQPDILVGSSGVFDSVVEMIEANLVTLHKTSKCALVEKALFKEIYKQILPLPYAERLKFKGLIEMRADMIVMSFILIDYVMEKYHLNKMFVSFYSLKEGVVIEKMKNTVK